MTATQEQCSIHPSAIVEDGAILGENVNIEAYAVVKSTVTLGNNVTVKSHAYIGGFTTIGDNCTIYPFACIGTKAQALKFKGEKTTIRIGSNTEIREYATINSSIGEGSEVSVGNNCMIMAYCHIAHNSTLGNNVILSNLATLAGHVSLEDHVIVGGMTPIHQFVRVGAYAMVGGMSRVTHDIPPYTIGAGSTAYKFGGLNMIGLKRHGFSLETRNALTRCFRLTYREGLHLDEALKRIESEVELLPQVQHWLSFCKNSKRGLTAQQGAAGEIDTEEDLDFLAEMRQCLI